MADQREEVDAEEESPITGLSGDFFVMDAVIYATDRDNAHYAISVDYVNSRTGERAPAFIPDIPDTPTMETDYEAATAQDATIEEMWAKMADLGITRD